MLGFIFRRTGDLLLALLCLAAIATFAGKLFWLLDMVSHFQVYYFLAAAALLVGNLFLKRRSRWLVSLALVGVGLYHLLPYFLPAPAVQGEGREAKIMQLNINWANQKTAAVKEAIAAADPDILILQEVNERWRSELDSLTKKYTHSLALPEDGAFGMWALSKLKFLDVDVQRRDGIAFLHLKYETGGRALEVIALHPFPPVGNAAWQSRNRLLQDAAVYASGDTSRIAVGDFNCSPWSPHFRSFVNATGLRDSARGHGAKITWLPTRLPFIGIPIDHVLVSPDIEVVAHEVGPGVGSDHLPVVVTFKLQRLP